MVEEMATAESESSEVEIIETNGTSAEKDGEKWDKKMKRRASEDPLWVYNGSKNAKNEEDELNKMDDDMFDWPKYLVQTGAKEVPPSLFTHVVPECMCGFEPGMKLEVPNRDYKNTYWLATIVAKATPLILVRYEGFQENNEEDFWCNTLSDDIHPVGWCARSKHALKPPKAIQHKEQNWYTYLIRNLTGAKKASENLFLKKSHPAHYLRAGQYIEILDQYNPLCYWLARVNEVFQGRLNLQYEGWEGKPGEFWCFYTHASLRPVGHGIENGLTLYPPKGAEPFSDVYINRLHEKVAAIAKRIDNSIFNSLFMGWPNKTPHNMSVGLKLEAIHPADPTAIKVASVSRIFDEYCFLVQVDTLLSQDDVENSFVAHKGSSCIFPVGFSSKNSLMVSPPSGYIGKFNWEAYLRYTKAEIVPDEFFEPMPTVDELEVGMKLEAVDKEHPSHICVCTITKIVGSLLWLHIDGDARDEQIVSINSKNIFPIGWCESTGHELQWPRPNTLEQKNRISSLRSTATRQNRLEVLRKGKLRQANSETATKDVTKKDLSLKQKRKSRYLKGHRGHTRKRQYYKYDDNDPTSYADNTIPLVCINQLASDYNTEDCIKKSFGLDSSGRLPKEVVTIDDDDDDDEPTLSSKAGKKYTEKDISYLSYIRVRPKNLTKAETEMFEKKLKENDANRGITMETLNSPSTTREKQSLNSVVAMLRSTNKQSGRSSHLLEQYKQSKVKKNTGKTNSSNKQSASFIDLSQDGTDTHIFNPGTDSLRPDSSVNIPGKGEYRIVEKIVTKQGDKNKIILKLGKPVTTQSENSITSTTVIQPSSATSTPPVHMITTNVNDMHTIQNMVRNHTGLNEIMKTRCQKVRSLCKDLPKNPLLWTKRHVAMFIQNADFKKFAKRFFDQEVDGHSLLLLTVWEIHNILGVQLGPAMKIHDYIFSLQQLVNDAYLKSKNKVLLQPKPAS